MIALQVAGSMAILAVFGLAQLGRISAGSWLYLWGNVAGSVALGVPALLTGQWGFVLLEGCWLLVSVVGILRKRTRDLDEGRPAIHGVRRAAP